MMSKSGYYETILASVYLEDSYVLWIEDGDPLKFRVDFVLLPDNSKFELPHAGEQYSYKTGYLVFKDNKIYCKNLTEGVTFSRDESKDYGNIDTFVCEKGIYKLTGDWGNIELAADEVTVDLD